MYEAQQAHYYGEQLLTHANECPTKRDVGLPPHLALASVTS